MDTPLDAIIIGAGSAGLAALREVRKQTEQFLIINDGAYGTTCARVGCMPSKLLIEAANAYHQRHTLAEFGITGADALAADLPAVLRRLRRLRDEQRKCIIFSTHIMQEVERLCDQVVVVAAGRTVAEGSVPQLLALTGQSDFEACFVQLAFGAGAAQ